MWAIILSFLSKYWQYIASGLGIAFTYFKVRQDGKNEVLLKQEQQNAKALQKVYEVEVRDNALPDSTIDERLSDKGYFRD